MVCWNIQICGCFVEVISKLSFITDTTNKQAHTPAVPTLIIVPNLLAITASLGMKSRPVLRKTFSNHFRPNYIFNWFFHPDCSCQDGKKVKAKLVIMTKKNHSTHFGVRDVGKVVTTCLKRDATTINRDRVTVMRSLKLSKWKEVMVKIPKM